MFTRNATLLGVHSDDATSAQPLESAKGHFTRQPPGKGRWGTTAGHARTAAGTSPGPPAGTRAAVGREVTSWSGAGPGG